MKGGAVPLQTVVAAAVSTVTPAVVMVELATTVEGVPDCLVVVVVVWGE